MSKVRLLVVPLVKCVSMDLHDVPVQHCVILAHRIGLVLFRQFVYRNALAILWSSFNRIMDNRIHFLVSTFKYIGWNRIIPYSCCIKVCRLRETAA